MVRQGNAFLLVILSVLTLFRLVASMVFQSFQRTGLVAYMIWQIGHLARLPRANDPSTSAKNYFAEECVDASLNVPVIFYSLNISTSAFDSIELPNERVHVDLHPDAVVSHLYNLLR